MDEIRFENDMIEFIFTFSPVMIYFYHENMAKQYFSPFSIFFFKVDKTPGIIFFILTLHTNLSWSWMLVLIPSRHISWSMETKGRGT